MINNIPRTISDYSFSIINGIIDNSLTQLTKAGTHDISYSLKNTDISINKTVTVEHGVPHSLTITHNSPIIAGTNNLSLNGVLKDQYNNRATTSYPTSIKINSNTYYSTIIDGLLNTSLSIINSGNYDISFIILNDISYN